MNETPPVRRPAGTPDHVVVTGDFNRDGKLDAATIAEPVTNPGPTLPGAPDSEVHVLFGYGDGTFQPRVPLLPRPVTYVEASSRDDMDGLRGLAAGDVDRDGNLDLAVIYNHTMVDEYFQPVRRDAYRYDVLLDVFYGDGTGAFSGPFTETLVHEEYDFYPPQRLPDNPFDPPAVQDATFLTMEDFTGDGILDAMFLMGGVVLAVAPGHGDGSFGPTIRTLATGTASRVASHRFLVRDFNRDGHLDVAQSILYATQIYLGDGTGAFVPVAGANDAFGVIGADDFNRDGVWDIVAVTGESPRGLGPPLLEVILGNGDGTFQARREFTMSLRGQPVIGDFDRDGIADVIALSDDGARIMWGVGDGSFIGAAAFGVSTWVNAPLGGGETGVLGDFDNDGFPDLVAAGSSLGMTVQLNPCLTP